MVRAVANPLDNYVIQLLEYVIPAAAPSAAAVSQKSPHCYGVSLCYGVSQCYGVSPCSGFNPCYGVSLCYAG